MLNEKDKGCIMLVLYSMIYIPGDLYASDLFGTNFCSGFQNRFAETKHEGIKVALRKSIQLPDFPYEELLPLLMKKYSRKEIFYYLSEFHSRLEKCQGASTKSNINP